MNYGLRRLAELGVKPTQIRGAKSRVWRQIMADVFNASRYPEGQQAPPMEPLCRRWCWRQREGEDVPSAMSPMNLESEQE
jgi:hypothetical protein